MTGQKKKRRQSGQKVTVRLWTEAVKALRVLRKRIAEQSGHSNYGEADRLVSAAVLLYERETVDGFSCIFACPRSGCRCSDTIAARQRRLDEQRAVEAQNPQPPSTRAKPQPPSPGKAPSLRLV